MPAQTCKALAPGQMVVVPRLGFQPSSSNGRGLFVARRAPEQTNASPTMGWHREDNNREGFIQEGHCMQRICTTEVPRHQGERVTVAGWLHSIRRLGAINFLVIRDGWGVIQTVAETEAELEPLLVEQAGVESIVQVEGRVESNAQAPGGYELHDLSITVLSPVTEAPPVTISKRTIKAGLGTILDHAVVTNRHPERRATLQLGAGIMAAFRATLGTRGFTEVQTPKIVASATESGANVFCLDYFARPAYLAQSPQFYKQVMVGVFERGFEVGPVFRAEPHETTRHINEYVSLDVEFGFIENHFTVMALLRDLLANIFD